MWPAPPNVPVIVRTPYKAQAKLIFATRIRTHGRDLVELMSSRRPWNASDNSEKRENCTTKRTRMEETGSERVDKRRSLCCT